VGLPEGQSDLKMNGGEGLTFQDRAIPCLFKEIIQYPLGTLFLYHDHPSVCLFSQAEEGSFIEKHQKKFLPGHILMSRTWGIAHGAWGFGGRLTLNLSLNLNLFFNDLRELSPGYPLMQHPVIHLSFYKIDPPCQAKEGDQIEPAKLRGLDWEST